MTDDRAGSGGQETGTYSSLSAKVFGEPASEVTSVGSKSSSVKNDESVLANGSLSFFPNDWGNQGPDTKTDVKPGTDDVAKSQKNAQEPAPLKSKIMQLDDKAPKTSGKDLWKTPGPEDLKNLGTSDYALRVLREAAKNSPHGNELSIPKIKEELTKQGLKVVPYQSPERTTKPGPPDGTKEPKININTRIRHNNQSEYLQERQSIRTLA